MKFLLYSVGSCKEFYSVEQALAVLKSLHLPPPPRETKFSPGYHVYLVATVKLKQGICWSPPETVGTQEFIKLDRVHTWSPQNHHHHSLSLPVPLRLLDNVSISPI